MRNVMVLCLFCCLAVPVYAVYEHIGCSGAELPVIQAAIHRSDIEHLDCVNYTSADNGPQGHPQTCSSSYGSGRWGNLECSPSAAGCDVSSYSQCGGSMVTLHAHCPMNQGGFVAGQYPKAVATSGGVQCNYLNIDGGMQTNTCTCSDRSGCS